MASFFLGATCRKTSSIGRIEWRQSCSRFNWCNQETEISTGLVTRYDVVLIISNIHFNFHKFGCVWICSLKFLPTPWIFEKLFCFPSICGLQVGQDLSTFQAPKRYKLASSYHPILSNTHVVYIKYTWCTVLSKKMLPSIELNKSCGNHQKMSES